MMNGRTFFQVKMIFINLGDDSLKKDLNGLVILPSFMLMGS
jgi:hypothetical protein